MAVIVGVAVFSVVWVVFCNVAYYALDENSVFARCFKFPGFLLVSNRLKDPERPQSFLAWDILDARHLVASAVPTEAKWHILAYRILVLFSFALGIVLQALWGQTAVAPVWLTFFTNWTFIAMALYSFMGICICLKDRKEAYSPSWNLLDKAFLIVFEFACTNGIFLTAFYWSVIYDGRSICADNVFRHGLNVLLMLGELFVSRVPVCTYHLQTSFLYLSTYALFFWVYFGLTGEWKYKALAWDSDWSFLYYTALPFLEAAAFYVMFLFAYLREKIFWSKEGKHENDNLDGQKTGLLGVV